MIESITATIPVTGQSYTDLRPTISASSIEEYREQLAEVGRLAGNDPFVERMTGQATKKSAAPLEHIVVDDYSLYFDPVAHVYTNEAGKQFMTGSTWAGTFAKPFNSRAIAAKTAEKKLTTPDKVLEGWEMKGEVSLLYGSTLHKALECGIKYGEIPNNPHLATLVQDYLDISHDDEQSSELFVADIPHNMCGTIDSLVNKGNKHVVVRDFKTGDIYKRTSLTDEARLLWPSLQNKMISIYQLQLSFYAFILEQKGYKVDELEIFAEADEAWNIVKLPVLDISGGLK